MSQHHFLEALKDANKNIPSLIAFLQLLEKDYPDAWVGQQTQINVNYSNAPFTISVPEVVQLNVEILL